ncbi:Integral membrane protein [Pleurostoma richardsiae]|uniref:Integral membrane protein n=1 Tax=Pleurostoma richardsiae TaxID=41990 RepID=A0AA38VH47_9PEZI|nr:Integral membrane protein [Pleurostoma richardsiae]
MDPNRADPNPYFDTRRGSAIPSSSTGNSTVPTTPATERPPPTVLPHSRAYDVRFPHLDRQQSAIRLRRLRPTTPGPAAEPDLPALGHVTTQLEAQQQQRHGDDATTNRRRSSSEPQRPTWLGGGGHDQAATMKPLPPVPESPSPHAVNRTDFQPFPPQARLEVPQPDDSLRPPTPGSTRSRRGSLRRGSAAFLNGIARRRQSVAAPAPEDNSDDDCYDSRIVDLLDVVDPEVATLSSITNIQNSLFVPSLGRWVNRRPTYDLSEIPQIPRPPGAYPPSQEEVTTGETQPSSSEEEEEEEEEGRPRPTRVHSMSSVLTAPQYAVLPNDATLEGWSPEDIKLLNDYVRHMLHSRRSKIKQQFKAFGKYVRRPLGFLVTLYATLITLFGLAWVLFLIGWIYVGDRQLYAINVIDNVLVALFAIVGDGLAPFRAVDTYHMIFIAHYHRKTWKLRKKLLLPKLKDHNDLPTEEPGTSDPTSDPASDRSEEPDLEAGQDAAAQEEKSPYEVPVLPPKQQARLVYHQTKFAKSHTFYKPHETETHHAFPLRLLIIIVVLLDMHSCLQIALGTTTWSTDYHHRSAAATTSILCCSITANLTAGVLISIGDRRTRKKDVVERMLKQELTQQAMHKVQKHNKKQAERAARQSEDGEGLREKWQRSLPGRLSDDWGHRSSEDHHGRSSSADEKDPRKDREHVGKFDTTRVGKSLDLPRINLPGGYIEEE